MKDSSSTQEPPVLAQPSFQQLLSAAFIVQEHNDRLQSSNDPEAGYTRTLGEIVETERLIQDSRVDFQTALEIIAERTQQITRADAVAIGLIENGQLVYRVDNENSSAQPAAPHFITDALAAECFRSGKLLQAPEAANDTRIDQALRRRLGVESLLAVPIRQEGKMAGVLELRFSRANGFQSQDPRTCQLMAGLLGEVLAGKGKQSWKQALASNEEAAMTAVLEQIRPELDRFTDKDDAEFERAVSGLTQENSAVDLSASPVAPPFSRAVQHTNIQPDPVQPKPGLPRVEQRKSLEELCQRCGQPFVRDEAFCGICGAMRGEDSPVVPAGNGKSASWTSLWDVEPTAESFMEPLEEDFTGSTHALARRDPVDLLAPDFDEEVASLTDDAKIKALARQSRWPEGEYLDAKSSPSPIQEVPQTASPVARFLKEHRATLYLVAAVVLLAVVIVGWENQPAPVAVAASTPATPELSLVDRMLVGLGLAEAPAAPVDMGDPDLKVWEDVHTALYYCPGAELYGKTKNGKYTRQHDAQLDQFQSASRKACQ